MLLCVEQNMMGRVLKVPARCQSHSKGGCRKEWGGMAPSCLLQSGLTVLPVCTADLGSEGEVARLTRSEVEE